MFPFLIYFFRTSGLKLDLATTMMNRLSVLKSEILMERFKKSYFAISLAEASSEQATESSEKKF